ncbi:helix-turn-helix domain-containing protein [Escherichia coli]|uniref:helix-turn-helix domain-containing protein n=2 Tax=Enterobacteriaceae TaxID=543 RepID=UPI0028DDE80C|nr:helix-turn-helix domain-containing protein [Escherichia coli]MDT9046471.1 helix-turn-helix domain-containing protein [Escherichia coli]
MRLTIDMVRLAYSAYFSDDNFSSHADLVLLCMAVGIGQLEGRPMSASKIAQYIGMPRVTVLRKLADLRARGLIERPTRRAYTLGSLEVPGPKHSRIIAALQRRVHEASTELSKLDS